MYVYVSALACISIYVTVDNAVHKGEVGACMCVCAHQREPKVILVPMSASCWAWAEKLQTLPGWGKTRAGVFGLCGVLL